MKTAFLLLLSALSCGAATVVAPPGTESVEGNSSAGPLFGGGAPARTQVVYGSQNFLSVPPGGMLISELRFRMDGRYGSGFSGGADLEIHLSTSTQNPDSLNQLFSANIGPDETVVFPRSTIALSSGAIPGGPNSFSVVIPLPTRFYYNPANGYLLMDIINKISGGLWIDEEEAEIALIELHMTEPVKFWGGIIGQLDRFDFTMQRRRSDFGVWFNHITEGVINFRKLFSTTRFHILERAFDLAPGD
jgi:hypothetical protein